MFAMNINSTFLFVTVHFFCPLFNRFLFLFSFDFLFDMLFHNRWN